jgi:hypothetical protein
LLPALGRPVVGPAMDQKRERAFCHSIFASRPVEGEESLPGRGQGCKMLGSATFSPPLAGRGCGVGVPPAQCLATPTPNPQERASLASDPARGRGKIRNGCTVQQISDLLSAPGILNRPRTNRNP